MLISGKSDYFEFKFHFYCHFILLLRITFFYLEYYYCPYRCFECLLNVAYKKDVRQWRVRRPNKKDKNAAKKAKKEKEIAKIERKKQIQKLFWSEMGLLIDVVKSGARTTNNGNTARRFFQNPELSAQITGIDLDLIKRFSTTLTTLSCGFPLNPDKFGPFC